MIACSWKYWLSSIAAWNFIVNLNKSFFSHKSYFNPIFSSWWNHRNSIFLWINSLPNCFLWINISDSSIPNKLELRCYPFDIFWHSKTHIQAAINWYKNSLRLICWICNNDSFCWWCFFLCTFVGCCCFLCSFFSFCNFCLCFLSFIECNNLWFWMKVFLVNG